MDALLILGMHRSGTSALAGQCASGGVWFGDNLLPPRPDNPKGYYENTDMMLSNEQLATLLFGGWHSPVSWTEAASSFPSGHQRVAAIQQSLQDKLGVMNTNGRLWAVKDPRLSRLLPIWWPMMQAMGIDAGLLMSIRRPAEVVASLEKRDCLGVTTSRLLWMRHVAEPLMYALDHDLRIVIVPYQELLAAPDGLADRLRSIGIHFEQSHTAFADGTLRHHAHECRLPDDELSHACDVLYRAVMSIPVFERATATNETRDTIQAACDRCLKPYLGDLYSEAMGISSAAQRLFHEQKKSATRAQERAVRQRLRNTEKALAACREEVARLKQLA